MEAEKEIDDQNLRLKIADEFGYKAMEDFIKEDLARDEKEEKKIKALRKEKKEREEKDKGKAGLRGFRFRGFDSKDKDFGSWRNFYGGRSRKGTDGFKSKEDIKCFNCQAVGHMARDCVKLSSRGRSRK